MPCRFRLYDCLASCDGVVSDLVADLLREQLRVQSGEGCRFPGRVNSMDLERVRDRSTERVRERPQDRVCDCACVRKRE